jgi:hypothetical protein
MLNRIPGFYRGMSIGASRLLLEKVARKITVATQTYYVRKDGSDSNTGLADNAGGAFLTIQAAINYVFAHVDAMAQSIIIQVRTGTYTEDLGLWPIVGAQNNGSIILRGDTTTPGNVIIAGTSRGVFALGYMNDWKVEGFKITSSGVGVQAHAGAWIRLGVMELGACTTAHCFADHRGIVELQGAYTISGSSPFHALTNYAGYVLNAGVLATLTGTPAFVTGFAYAINGGRIEWTGGTFSGSGTGVRYVVSTGGQINVGAAAYSSFFPGNAAGSVLAGGLITGTTTESAVEKITATDHLIFNTAGKKVVFDAGGSGHAASAAVGGHYAQSVAADALIGCTLLQGIYLLRDATAGGFAIVAVATGEGTGSIIYQTGANFSFTDPGSNGSKWFISSVDGSIRNRYNATHIISYLALACVGLTTA